MIRHTSRKGRYVPKKLPLRDATAPVCCSPLAAGAMNEDTAIDVALRLRALADPVRLRLLSLILEAPTGEACNCELSPVLGLSDATISHHLKALREAGLIIGERRGTWIYYRPVRPALGALCRVIDPNCC
jgi:ArsR family transcriptional regulator